MQFVGFEGALNARVGMFSAVEMTGSHATLTGADSQLFDVDTWTMTESSLSGDFGLNNFNGDTLNLTYNLTEDEDGIATVFDAKTAEQIAGWDNSLTKVNINGDAATFNGTAWCAGSLQFGLDAEDSTKLVISKISMIA